MKLPAFSKWMKIRRRIPKEWKGMMECFNSPLKKIDIETFRKQFMEHPNKENFINWKDDWGHSMLHYAVVWSKRLDVVNLLLEHGADVNIADKNGQTVLMEASFHGQIDFVKFLLEKGADINIVDKYGRTALTQAFCVDNGYNDIVKLLVEKGADVHSANTEGETALMWASDQGHTETVKLLLEKGADITLADKYGETALMKASSKGYSEIVELLDKGADITLKEGETALSLATKMGHDDTEKLLLENLTAADPNRCDSDGQTFLHHACLKNNKVLAQHLLEVGIIKDKLDDDLHTALFYAAEKGFADLVDLLIMHNADVNKTDERKLTTNFDGEFISGFYTVKDGRTPLFVAAQNGYQDIVASLLQHGADPCVCNHESLIPRDVSKNHAAIQQLFRIHDYFVRRKKGDGSRTITFTCKQSRTISSPDEVVPLKDIIHDIVKYPHFANKFLEIYQENREIVNWLDDNGRTVQQVACKQCREAIMFMGRYHVDGQPKYESPTCKIYHALDYGGPDEDLKHPRKVAMKFMENEDHYLNEMQSRRNKDGSPRFSSDFVTPDLADYRADQNAKYAQACMTWQQTENFPLGYSFCVVMPLADRSLLESMTAENLKAEHKDLQRREILLNLSRIFSFIHGKGYIHGDIKPHNVVRHMDGGNVAWKAIDFDACTKIGDAVGLKLTTGSAPPEMLKIIEEEGEEVKIILRQPGTDDGLDESELIKADPSFDVWSFGILMFQLETGRTFFHCDDQGNLDDEGLQELANLKEGDIHEKLGRVKDITARLLLSKLLHLNPEERPTMSEVGQNYYLNPSATPQGRQSEFFHKKGFDDTSKENPRPPTWETKEETGGVAKDEDDSDDDNTKELKRFLSSRSELSYFNMRDEDKDWSDQLLNSEIKSFSFDRLEGMGEKPKCIDGDTIYNNEFLRNLLSNNGPDYFMGFLVEYFELYKIMHDAHQVCQQIKANLVSDVKSLKGIFIKLFVRGKGLNDIVRGTLFCNSIDLFKYVGTELKEKYGHNVYIKPPKPGAWPIPKLLIYSKNQIDGRCMSVEIQFSTVYMHLALHASNSHVVYEAMRESTGYLAKKNEEFQKFVQLLNRQHIDTEGFLPEESTQEEGRFEILVAQQVGETDESGESHTGSTIQESDKQYTTKATGLISSGRVRCGDRMFQFLKSEDDFQRFSESSFVVNKSLTLLSSHSYWSEESYDLEGKSVEFVVSFKGRGLAIAGIGTERCIQGKTEGGGGGERCSVHVGRSKFVVRKNGVEKDFQEKKLPNQERAKILFKMKDGELLVSFVGSGREGDELSECQVSLHPGQRYYLYMRAPPGVHDVKFHDVNIK